MQLIYRGNKYNYNALKSTSRPLQMVRDRETAYDLTYRGVTYRVDLKAKFDEIAVPVASHKLTYRGVSYFKSNHVLQGITTVPNFEIAA